jgi:hypothetical protein
MLADSVDEFAETVGVVAPTDSDVALGRSAPRHPAATVMRDKAKTVRALGRDMDLLLTMWRAWRREWTSERHS